MQLKSDGSCPGAEAKMSYKPKGEREMTVQLLVTLVLLGIAVLLAIKSYLPEHKHGKRDDVTDKFD